MLNPQKNDYLYFQMDTVKNDGSNIFSKTYEEHKAASADYRSGSRNHNNGCKTKNKEEIKP